MRVTAQAASPQGRSTVLNTCSVSSEPNAEPSVGYLSLTGTGKSLDRRRRWQPTPVFLPGESQTEEPGVGLQESDTV